MTRGRSTVAAVALAIALSGALAVTAGASPPRGAPPTVAEVEAATERFLERQRGPAAARRGENGGLTPAPGGAILPANRVVSLYGAPQLPRTIVGMKSPKGAAAKLLKQSDPYASKGTRPVVGAIDLIATIATAGPGTDRKYRTRQPDEVIGTYLKAARSVGARLMLDVQPGRSSLLAEVRALREWLVLPDVDLAIDPEWAVGRRGVPGRTPGKVSARKLNKVSLRLAQTVEAAALPPKLLIVHQFRAGSVRGRSRVVQRPGVEVVLNFDGIGSPRAKASGYAELAARQLFDGFSLFYRRDRPLMQPASVLRLLPEPDFLLYQ
ncbi:MAG: hypothetical protein ACRDK9_10635 [Solirubrobacterales bacterium]